MARTHAQQFARLTLPRTLVADALALTQAIDRNDAAKVLATWWDAAGGEMAPILRKLGTGMAATIERRSMYTIAIVTPPAPRESGDPALIAIVGRGDGVSRMSTIGTYVLELQLEGAAVPQFVLTSRDGNSERPLLSFAGPLPDPHTLADHAFALYTGRTPDLSSDAITAQLPFWYWWHAFDGASAFAMFNDASDEIERFAVVRRNPVLLMPEIADAAEVYVGGKPARRLRELRPYLRRDPSLTAAWQALVDRLWSTRNISHTLRTLPLIAEAGQHGAFSRAHACEQEAIVRSLLAALGVEPHENHQRALELHAAGREAAAAEHAPRAARGSAPPPISAEDPVWKPLFLDESEVPHAARTTSDETFSSADPTFLAYGGIRAGYAAWRGDERSPLAHLVDARWVFRTAAAAAQFLRAPVMASVFADGLPPQAAPTFGDDTLAFGSDFGQRTQVIVVRVGRVIARLQATEGAYALSCRQILHSTSLHPLAQRMVQRARQGLAAYWLAVAYPTNAVPALVHAHGHNASGLLEQYPLLAHADLPAALATLGDTYVPVARSLASFQVQLRAHRWDAYRDAMRALVRSLLDSEMGDPRVNVSYAYDIVCELRCLDPDPIWNQLDAECRTRG